MAEYTVFYWRQESGDSPVHRFLVEEATSEEAWEAAEAWKQHIY